MLPSETISRIWLWSSFFTLFYGEPTITSGVPIHTSDLDRYLKNPKASLMGFLPMRLQMQGYNSEYHLISGLQFSSSSLSTASQH